MACRERFGARCVGSDWKPVEFLDLRLNLIDKLERRCELVWDGCVASHLYAEEEYGPEKVTACFHFPIYVYSDSG